MKRAVGAAATMGVLLALAVAATALAAPAQVTIDTREVDLAKSGDDWTASIGLTNLTDREIVFEVPPVGDGGNCDPTLDNEGKLPDSEHKAFTVTIPSTCDVDEEKGIEFRVEGTTSGTEVAAAFDVTAGPEPEEDPEWSALRAFLYVLIGLAVIAIMVVAGKARKRVAAPLKYLGDSWSFKESWVSSVTVLGGLLTGIFGSSEVVKAILGEDAESAVALATVGAAIAVAMIAAAPLILEATKVRDDGSRETYFSLGGLVAASVVTLAAAAGELWVVYRSGTHLDLGGFEDLLVIFLVLGLLLLAAYAVTAIPRTIRLGTTKPVEPPKPPGEESDAIKAARIIAEELRKAQVDVETTTVERAVKEAAEAGAPPVPPVAPEPVQPAAMI
ncbi:MAG TPA: hypothetical protein VNP96_01555 [Solirubrobacterales bacterium]|nr:hypothetical protein [Solirubrobacterales bacterium]